MWWNHNPAEDLSADQVPESGSHDHSLGVLLWRSPSTPYSWGVLFLAARCLTQWFLLLINHIGFHWGEWKFTVLFCGDRQKVVLCSQVRLVCKAWNFQASFDYAFPHTHTFFIYHCYIRERPLRDRNDGICIMMSPSPSLPNGYWRQIKAKKRWQERT